MFEDFRQTLIKPEITLPKGGGLFRKHVTMQSSLERNRKASEDRKRALSSSSQSPKKTTKQEPEKIMVNVKKIKE